MSGLHESKDRTSQEGGQNGGAGDRGKDDKSIARALTTPLVEGKEEPVAVTREMVELQDSTSPYLFMAKVYLYL
jgi:hypothetical protein